MCPVHLGCKHLNVYKAWFTVCVISVLMLFLTFCLLKLIRCAFLHCSVYFYIAAFYTTGQNRSMCRVIFGKELSGNIVNILGSYISRAVCHMS